MSALFGTQAAIDSGFRREPDYDLEGIVIAGSWNPSNNTVQIQEGASASAFPDSSDQPFIFTATIQSSNRGQYGPVGGEYAVAWRSQGGYIANIENSFDQSPQVPAGEYWQPHYNAAGVMDAVYKHTNDGPTPGDGLGGTHVGGTGALFVSTAVGPSGTFTISSNAIDKTHTIETPAGHTIVADDKTGSKGVTIRTAGGLSAHFNDVASTITNAASSQLYTIWDATGNGALSHVASAAGGVVALGALASSLDATLNQAVRQQDLTAAINKVRGGMGNLLQQFLTMVATAGGLPTGGSASALLASLIAGGLPTPSSFTDITSTITAIATPPCSSKVLIK